MNGHMSDSQTFEAEPDGSYRARCECGFNYGPFPGVEDAVDALMDHAYMEGMDDPAQPIQQSPEGGDR